MYIKLYEFCFYCVYNTIRVSERIPGRIRGVFRNGRLGARILCILSYTHFIMIVYIMLYIYGLYKAHDGVCTRLWILRHTTSICSGFKLCITAIHVFKVVDFDCVYKLYTLLMSGRGLTYGVLVTWQLDCV